MPTERQQRALGRADQDFGSGFAVSLATAMSSLLAAFGCVCYCARASSCHVSGPQTRPEGYAGSLDSPVRPVSLLQTRGPQAAPLQATFVRSGAFWTWWLAFRGARLRGDVSDDDLSSSSISKAGQAIAKSSQQQFHCKRQRRNRLGTSTVVSTTLHDRKNASAATRGNKSCILRPREAAAAPGRGGHAKRCDPVAAAQPAPRAGTTR